MVRVGTLDLVHRAGEGTWVDADKRLFDIYGCIITEGHFEHIQTSEHSCTPDLEEVISSVDDEPLLFDGEAGHTDTTIHSELEDTESLCSSTDGDSMDEKEIRSESLEDILDLLDTIPLLKVEYK